MGRITKVLSFIRAVRNDAKLSDVKVNAGGEGNNLTVEHYSAIGDDAHPLPDDYAIAVPTERAGVEAAVGYADTQSEPKAEAGEKRIYSRSGQAATVAEVWLKNTGVVVISNDNGTVELKADGSIKSSNDNGSFELKADGSIKGSNDNGSFELQAAGDFFVNGVTIDTSGRVTIPSSLTLDGNEIAGHDHSQPPDSGGDTQENTGPNN